MCPPSNCSGRPHESGRPGEESGRQIRESIYHGGYRLLNGQLSSPISRVAPSPRFQGSVSGGIDRFHVRDFPGFMVDIDSQVLHTINVWIRSSSTILTRIVTVATCPVLVAS